MVNIVDTFIATFEFFSINLPFLFDILSQNRDSQNITDKYFLKLNAS